MKPIEIRNLKEIVEANYKIVFPTALSIKIAKLSAEIESNIELYKKVLNKLVDECAEKDENNKPIIDDEGNLNLLPDKVNDWTKGVSELEESDSFNIVTTFTNSEIEQMSITPMQARTLLKIIKEEPKD